MAPSLTRREALGGALAAPLLASCGGGDPPPSTGPKPGSGAALLGSLLALERAAVAAFGACAEQLNGRPREEVRAIRGAGARARDGGSRADPGASAESRRPAGAAEEYARSFPRAREPPRTRSASPRT